MRKGMGFVGLVGHGRLRRPGGGDIRSSFVKFLIRHWVTLSKILLIAGVFAEEAQSSIIKATEGENSELMAHHDG